MDRRIVPLLAFVALGAQGCSVRYQKAIVAAEHAAELGHWSDAVTQYATALQVRPENVKVSYKLVAASQAAADEATAQARAALEAGDWATVVARLDYVATLEHADVPEAFDLRRQAETGLAAQVTDLWQLKDPRKVYTEVIRFRTMFPKSPELGPMFDQVRRWYIEQAEALRVAGRYEEALASVATIAEFEPDQKPILVDPMERHIRSSWADALSQEAKLEDAAKRLGAACMLYARAYEVGGRGMDRAEALRIADRIRAQGDLSIAVQVRGSPSRSRSLTQKVENAVSALGEKAAPKEADLTIYLNAPQASCSEKVSSSRKEQEFVAGQVDVPNPEHVRITHELKKAEAKYAEHHDDAMARWSTIEDLEHELETLDVSLAATRKTLQTSGFQEEEARKQVEQAAKFREQQQTQIEALRAQRMTTDAVNAEATKLEQTVNILVEWQSVLQTAERDRREAEPALLALDEQREPLVTDLAALRAEYTSLIDQRDRLDVSRQKLAAQQKAIPATVRKDVKDAVDYDEKVWTRTCTTQTYATVKPRWSTELKTDQKFVGTKTTTDTQHGAYAAAGIESDPKAYSEDDATLLAAADRQTAGELLGWLADLAEEHYEVSVQEALAQMQQDPRSATTSLLSVYLVAPERLDQYELGDVQRHLISYGVKDLRAVLSTSLPVDAVAAQP